MQIVYNTRNTYRKLSDFRRKLTRILGTIKQTKGTDPTLKGQETHRRLENLILL